MSKDFTVDEIRELLGELGARLCAKGITPTIRLVGGAAVAFMGNDRRVTQDIDASYTPKPTLNASLKQWPRNAIFHPGG